MEANSRSVRGKPLKDAQCGEFHLSDSVSELNGGDDFVAGVSGGVSARDQLFDVLSRESSFIVFREELGCAMGLSE